MCIFNCLYRGHFIKRFGKVLCSWEVSRSAVSGPWGKGVEVTLSGCLPEGSGSRDCCVLFAIYPLFDERDIKSELGRCERWLWGVVKGLRLWGW